MTTYGDCNTVEDDSVDANTEVLIADLTIPSGKGGRIKKILYSYAQNVDAAAATGYLELKMGSHSGPFRFPLGMGAGGATSSSHGPTGEIDVDIECYANETVKVYITPNAALLECHAGIIWVSG